MMRRLSQIVTLLLVCSISMFMACEGPSGPEGPQGQQGPEGPVGPAGEDGSMMYSGEGAPTSDIGSNGDYYLNTNTGEMYGPKDDNGWGNPIIVLMGEDGQDGEDGTQIYSGSGAPADSIGSKGDFYIDIANQDLYGPKNKDGWGQPADLSGQDGQDGEDGSVIHAGTGPPSASLGKVGDFYLDQSTGDFYGPKTQNGWGSPTNLKGDDGDDGQDGEDGSVIHAGTGPPSVSLGKVGDFYLDQSTGDFYGPKTQNGWGQPTNLKGDDGKDGQDGEDGSQIHSGTGVPAASLGKEGDYYLDVSTNDLYGPKTQNGWGTPVNLNGDDGQDGQDGADGEDGSQIYSGTGAPAASLGKEGDYYLDKSNYDMYGPKTSNGWGMPINLKGADGNANVTRYIFPGIDLTQQSYSTVKISGLSLTQMKNSAWHVYVVLKGNNTNISGKYYSVPGVINSTMYSMDYYYSKNDNNVNFTVRRDVSANGTQFDRVEIVRVEASNTEDQRKQKSGEILPSGLDTSDYEAVAEYYGFYR